MLIAIIISAILMITGYYLCTILPALGSTPDACSQARIQQSPHYNGRQFENTLPTSTLTLLDEAPSFREVVRSFVWPEREKTPCEPLPSEPITRESELPDDHYRWLGHSAVLGRSGGVSWITDPVFHQASPIPGTVKPFALTHDIDIAALPPVDVVLISHDHYDHLDHRTIRQLSHTVTQFLVPLGVKAHLLRWGVTESQVTEFDWHESITIGNTQFTFTPARHFSGRAPRQNNRTLWGSWVIQAPGRSVFFSGDSGYTEAFREIGERYGPFDLAFIENGAYNPRWSEVHMQPEESAQVCVDLRAASIFPIHWGKFDLSLHRWQEPAERIETICRQRNIPLATARIGASFSLDNLPKDRWWQALTDNQTADNLASASGIIRSTS